MNAMIRAKVERILRTMNQMEADGVSIEDLVAIKCVGEIMQMRADVEEGDEPLSVEDYIEITMSSESIWSLATNDYAGCKTAKEIIAECDESGVTDPLLLVM